MYNRIEFNKLLSSIPRSFFIGLVKKYVGDKGRYKFSSWDHLVAMLYGQLNGCRSLREITDSFTHYSNFHYHLGISSGLKRSTFSDANTSRDYGLFAELANYMAEGFSNRRCKGIKDFLYIMDSTPIQLKGYGHRSWSCKDSNYRIKGLKLHVNYCFEDSSLREFMLSNSNVNDIDIGRRFELSPGVIYCFDKGYYDYNWWYKIDEIGSKFVTRQKVNSAIKVHEELALSESAKLAGIVRDELVSLNNKKPRGGKQNNYYGKLLRRVEVKLSNRDHNIVLLSNALDYSSEEIADTYRKRWAIELCFKWLKQNLKLKSFVGYSENAVKIQIYCAIISYFLLLILKKMQNFKGSLRDYMIYIKANLFQRPDTLYYLYRKRQIKLQNSTQNQLILI